MSELGQSETSRIIFCMSAPQLEADVARLLDDFSNGSQTEVRRPLIIFKVGDAIQRLKFSQQARLESKPHVRR